MVEEIIKLLIECDWFIHGVKSSEENLPSLLSQRISEVFDIVRTGRRIDDTIEMAFFLDEQLLVVSKYVSF